MHNDETLGDETLALPVAEIQTGFQPLDEANLELLNNVHPADWVNPTPKGRYHLVVLGGGTAGLVSAAAAAGLGASVALVERGALGGDCLNHGCVPSKALISSARRHRLLADSGLEPSEDDFTAAMKRMRELRASISHHDSASRFAGLGIDVYLGNGQFVARDALEVDGARLDFRRAIVATGAKPMVLPIPGLAESRYLTNETVFNLTTLPRRLALIGAGPIGCELAQVFARFGSRVMLFDIAPQVLPREDPEAAAIVERALRRDGIDLALGTTIEEVHRTDARVTVRFGSESGKKSQGFDELLLAVGRTPNIDGLGLDKAGVEAGRQGVVVDDRLRTSNRRIYAVGDVASQYKFTHVADALARIAIQNALFFGRKKASDLVIPWCTYTDPEVAHVGLTGEQARERGHDVETITIPLADVDRAVLESAGEGFLRLYALKRKGRILGATIVAEHAGDLLGELTLAVTHGIGLAKISSTIHPYPTQAEIVRKAGDAWMRGRLTPLVLGVLRTILKLVR